MALVLISGSASILASSFFWSDWVGKRTVPEQRLVLLQMAIIPSLIGLTALVISCETTSYWAYGDVVLILIVTFYYSQGCVMNPTTMNIAALGACSKAKHADGTIMGILQMCSNAGQAV